MKVGTLLTYPLDAYFLSCDSSFDDLTVAVVHARSHVWTERIRIVVDVFRSLKVIADGFVIARKGSAVRALERMHPGR